tara:strand:- start:1432 stop:1773 length:342 start_codon:yes stop_codon:yes gene_type:complete
MDIDMPQYGAGVSFSKMKRKMQKRKDRKQTKKKRRIKTRLRKLDSELDREVSRKLGISTSKEKPCQCGTHRYKGTEPTPRGLGKCEECIPLHVILRGKDGQLYENKGNTWSLL